MPIYEFPEDGIRSRPIYRPLQPDVAARFHLMVAEGAGAEALARLHDKLPDEASCSIHYLAGSDGPDGSDRLMQLDCQQTRIHFDDAQLADALRRELENASMGTRLYVAGGEGFIWRMAAVGASCGMSEEEVHVERCGSLARPAQCVHCKTRVEGVTTNIYECPGCGLHVTVRDHFSRRHGAYQSVRVDAEAPGELPPIEETYR
ncbi:hypothetical protein M0534_13465 [Methylonatrum kenyense]|uniref:dimethylamine monooxygenase subunit DmmA family protein n=1 Tax=Methylonatrum kenyense TaxID=455253 RepID=UPI0020BF758A|nr:dimethylamine monooxygenase subunit DmmA family protein [Methylonatrum kenyense]MCK8517324.1 hypothetical protein [Methylonatrum kenyense]